MFAYFSTWVLRYIVHGAGVCPEAMLWNVPRPHCSAHKMKSVRIVMWSIAKARLWHFRTLFAGENADAFGLCGELRTDIAASPWDANGLIIMQRFRECAPQLRFDVPTKIYSSRKKMVWPSLYHVWWWDLQRDVVFVSDIGWVYCFRDKKAPLLDTRNNGL